MYRSKLWTMRMFAGFGTAEDTNAALPRDPARRAATGLSTAFDLPTLHGPRLRRPASEGEVGKCGVAVDTLADMEDLFAGIDLGEVTTSMTINSPAAVILAMYVAVAEKNGVERARLGGTLQNDILKEYQAQKEFVFPPRPSMRLVARHDRASAPPRCPGGTRSRSPATTSARRARRPRRSWRSRWPTASPTSRLRTAAGLDVDAFAPRLSFFFNAHIDFFEEIAKYRAARRIWARWMRDRYGATAERSLQLRFHTQTAGVSLTAQQPEVNIARTAIEALAGVLGGTQSLHTNSMDEALALPTEKAARIALRTQQVIAHETGVANVADPLGGSWFVEALTDEMERQAEDDVRPPRRARAAARCSKACTQASTTAGSRARSPTRPTSSSGRSTAATASSSGVNRFTEGNDDDDLDILQITARAGAAADQAAAGGARPTATATRSAPRSTTSEPTPPTPSATSCRR